VTDSLPFGTLLVLLRCLECRSNVELVELAPTAGYPDLGPDGWLACTGCGERYPMIGGTPRMLPRSERSSLAARYPDAAIELAGAPATDSSDSVKRLTAESFTYEWRHFGGPRPEWRKNFVDYMQPHDPASLNDKLVLDVGTGSGRHSAHAASCGARVVAVDLGQSIDVARRNVPREVLTVQADAEQLPFDPGTFDLVMSIGVLHHLSDTEQALRSIIPLATAGGHVHVYLYWVPEHPGHRAVLRLVSLARRITTRIPHLLLHALCYPVAAVLWAGVVLPYRAVRRLAPRSRLAEAFPLKTYADYPFGVLVNDTFDRFSAPIEHRFTRREVAEMLERADLEDVTVIPNHGWIGDARVPAAVADIGPGSVGRASALPR
jgi:SAM-dependent methyltransferase/uncharacterized protein YbaR (Trm112 family)